MSPADLEDGLERLSMLMPDAQRTTRTAERCRAVLQRRAQPMKNEAGRLPDTAVPSPGLRFRTLATGAMGLLCLAYVVSLIATTLSLSAPLH